MPAYNLSSNFISVYSHFSHDEKEDDIKRRQAVDGGIANRLIPLRQVQATRGKYRSVYLTH